MKENNIKKKIGLYIIIFESFKKANLLTFYRKKTSSSIILNWIFMAFPVLFYSINIFFFIKNNVFWNKDIELCFLKDLSNSLGLSVLYFLSYFLSWYYPRLFENWILNDVRKNYFDEVCNYQKHIKKSKLLLLVLGVFLFVIGFLAGYSFYGTAKANGIKMWTYHLDIISRICYCLFLGITWYHSLSLLGMAVFGGFVVFWCIKDNAINYINIDYNKNVSIINAVNILLCTFSYGLFYIVGSILFILNDKVAAEAGVFNTFSNDIASFFLILIVLLIVFLVYIPLQELLNYMGNQKKQLINYYNNLINEEKIQKERDSIIENRNKIIEQGLINTSLTNKLIVILSILVPLIGVFFQGVELFG